MAFSRSLVPAFFGRDWWDTWEYPKRLLDQQFAVGLVDEDLATPPMYHGFYMRPRRQVSQKGGFSEVVNDAEQFKVNLDVSHFSPNEIQVKSVDNALVISGKHEEKADQHGYISREFTRKYVLPAGIEADSLVSSLSSDGILTVKAAKKAIEPPKCEEKPIPISLDSAAAAEVAPPQEFSQDL